MAQAQSKDELGILEELYVPKYLINTTLFGRRIRLSYNKERWARSEKNRIAIVVVHHESAWARRVAKGVVSSLTNVMAPDDLPSFDVLSADASADYLADNVFTQLEQHRAEYAAVVTIGSWVSTRVRDYLRLHKWKTTQVFLGVPDPVAAGLIPARDQTATHLVGVNASELDYSRYVALLKIIRPQAKTVLIPYDPTFVYAGFENEKKRLTQQLESKGVQVRVLTVDMTKGVAAQLEPHLKNIDIVWSLQEEATQVHARHIAKVCSANDVLFCAADLASVFQGASIGFGDSGSLTGMYGGQLCFALCAGFDEKHTMNNLEVLQPAALRINPGFFEKFGGSLDPQAAALMQEVVPLGWE